MEVKSTIKIFNEAEVKVPPGEAEHVVKTVVGGDVCPSERIRMIVATFEAA